MRSIKSLIAGLAMALLVTTGAFAGSNLNEVGAMLVYPTIISDSIGPFQNIETLVTITNAGPDDVYAHISYINGDWTDHYKYCYECDFELPLSGNDTETLVITSLGGGGTRIETEDNYGDETSIVLSCPWNFGMLVVTLEDGDGSTLTDNVLLGEEVILDYGNGMAVSFPAVSLQGKDGGNGDRMYGIDDSEYGKLPRIVAADFLAPDGNNAFAALSLFTLGFERQFPPLTDCSVIGFDANEHPFSASFQFGCWTIGDLRQISPEFAYGNLGLYNGGDDGVDDTHGWLQLNCRVDSDDDGTFDANGAVHGAIIQAQNTGSTLGAGSGTPFANAAAWGRLLYQSVTTGDAVTLVLEEPYDGGLF